MRQYECECTICKCRTQVLFQDEPYPDLGQIFPHMCRHCQKETPFTRTITKKAQAEQRRQQEESDLRQRILDLCEFYGFSCRFVYQSVVISTALSDWSFDYHQSHVTLYHESTVKINFQTGDYARSHVQFRNLKMTITEVIDYIAAHDKWRKNQNQFQ